MRVLVALCVAYRLAHDLLFSGCLYLVGRMHGFGMNKIISDGTGEKSCQPELRIDNVETGTCIWKRLHEIVMINRCHFCFRETEDPDHCVVDPSVCKIFDYRPEACVTPTLHFGRQFGWVLIS